MRFPAVSELYFLPQLSHVCWIFHGENWCELLTGKTFPWNFKSSTGFGLTVYNMKYPKSLAGHIVGYLGWSNEFVVGTQFCPARMSLTDSPEEPNRKRKADGEVTLSETGLKSLKGRQA